MPKPTKRKSPGRYSGTGAQIRVKANCNKPEKSVPYVNAETEEPRIVWGMGAGRTCADYYAELDAAEKKGEQ